MIKLSIIFDNLKAKLLGNAVAQLDQNSLYEIVKNVTVSVPLK